MKVSVVTTTYNHEDYIAQTVDSVVTQRAGFDYEMVVAEDASTDRTGEIVRALAEQYRGKLRVLFSDRDTAERDRERGMGGKTGFITALQSCRSQYIALLDGDDYWTDPDKLQKQVDFLDGHPDYVICHHDMMLVFEDSHRPPKRFSTVEAEYLNRPLNEREMSIEDLLDHCFMVPSSVMFRNHLIDEFPAWFYEIETGDWPLFVLLAAFGNIGYLDEVMGVWRRHEDSYAAVRFDNKQGHSLVYFCKYLELFNRHLDFRYDSVIAPMQRRWFDVLDQYTTGLTQQIDALTPGPTPLGWVIGALLYLQSHGVRAFLLKVLQPWRWERGRRR